jgi:DNA-binding transcriptional LysR family regulator
VAIAPKRSSSPGLIWTPLFSEGFLTLARAGNPKIRKTLSLEAYCSLSHVFVSPEGRAGSVVDEALGRLGRKRHVALTVGSFLAVPLVVADSDLLATTAARIAQRFAAAFPLQIFRPPLELPRFTLALAWHERFRKDPAHVWFRSLVAEVGRTMRDKHTVTAASALDA